MQILLHKKKSTACRTRELVFALRAAADLILPDGPAQPGDGRRGEVGAIAAPWMALEISDIAFLADVWVAARHGADWAFLEKLEEELCQEAAQVCVTAERAGVQPPFSAFHGLLLPMRRNLQLQIAVAHATALRHANNRPSHFPDVSAPSTLPLPPLRVSILRGSSNSNVDRIAAILSLTRRQFTPKLFTTHMDPGAIAQLQWASPGGQSLDHTNIGSTMGSAEAAHHISTGWSCALLVDCSGHTAGNLLHALVRRPCRVATSALGYAGSYGGGLVDYLTADRVAVAPEHSGSWAREERLALLPHSYQVSPVAFAGELVPPASTALAHNLRPLIGTFTRTVQKQTSCPSANLAPLSRAYTTPHREPCA